MEEKNKLNELKYLLKEFKKHNVDYRSIYNLEQEIDKLENKIKLDEIRKNSFIYNNLEELELFLYDLIKKALEEFEAVTMTDFLFLLKKYYSKNDFKKNGVEWHYSLTHIVSRLRNRFLLDKDYDSEIFIYNSFIEENVNYGRKRFFFKKTNRDKLIFLINEEHFKDKLFELNSIIAHKENQQIELKTQIEYLYKKKEEFLIKNIEEH